MLHSLKDCYDCFLPSLVKKHLNEHIIYDNFSFLNEKKFWNMPICLLHNLIYCFWTIFIFKHIFCLPKKPQYRFFSDDWFANLFSANKLYDVVFLSSFCIQLFHTFIMVQVFQGPGFSESRFFRVQVFLVQVQCLGPGFRSSF